MKIAEGSKTTHTVFGLAQGEPYHFKVRGRNICHTGEFSEDLTVYLADVPAQMEQVVAKIVDCSARFSWKKPADGGSNIISYSVEVRDVDQVKYHQVNDCSRSVDSLTCEVSLATFTRFPWNLKSGQLIHVRARAINRFGFGQNSEVSESDKTLFDVPAEVQKFKIDSKTAYSIKLTWDAVEDEKA